MKKWLSKDPISEAGGVNLYGFVNNEPISRYDIFGLEVANCNLDLEVDHGHPNPSKGPQYNKVQENIDNAKKNQLSPANYRTGGVGCYSRPTNNNARNQGYGLDYHENFSITDTQRAGTVVFYQLPKALLSAKYTAAQMCADEESCCKMIIINVNIASDSWGGVSMNILYSVTGMPRQFLYNCITGTFSGIGGWN